MRDRFNEFFNGRQGMDEFSKFLFWNSLGLFAASLLLSGFAKGAFSTMLLGISTAEFIFCFYRVFSKNIYKREMENNGYLALAAKRRQENLARKDRFSQRKHYRFYKCPGCKTWLRVPRGKGKIHISCRCGYTLYRKT